MSPVIGRRKAKDIKRRDLVLLLEKIVDRGSPNQSWQTLKVLRRMFNFAVERDILEYSPCTHIKPVAKLKSKTRWLTDDEIKWLWNKLTTVELADRISDATRRALKVILVTGQRPGEVLGIEWSEIDGDWWTIPPNKTKNGREQRVFLTPLAKELIGNYGSYPFPSPRSGGQMDVNNLGRAVRRLLTNHNAAQAKKERAEVEKFTPHDLRRTAATHMAQLGIAEFVIGKVLNHTNESITGVYNRYAYDEEKQQALTSWAERLNEIVSKTQTPAAQPATR